MRFGSTPWQRRPIILSCGAAKLEVIAVAVQARARVEAATDGGGCRG